MLLTGGQIIAKFLAEANAPLVTGIPGHGIWSLLDAFADCRDRFRVIKAMHEQSAAHMADGYYRATGRPLAVFTSIGPGATNHGGHSDGSRRLNGCASIDGQSSHLHARTHRIARDRPCAVG